MMHGDFALAQAASYQMYIAVGQSIAGVWNVIKSINTESRGSVCADGRHKRIVSLLSIIDCFNRHDWNFAVRCLSLCGPCPRQNWGRVSQIVARVWAFIGRMHVIPNPDVLNRRVWTIECMCTDVGTSRSWLRLLYQWLHTTAWDYQDLDEDTFDMWHEFFVMSVYAPTHTLYVEQQLLCIQDMVEMFLEVDNPQ